jgi:hypothetical protein
LAAEIAGRPRSAIQVSCQNMSALRNWLTISTLRQRGFLKATHEDDWLFYHDALWLTTAKETVKYMKEKDYLKRWILPELGLNDDIPRYSKRPVGNSPEVMNWDSSLNKDVHECINRHITISKELPDDDPCRFSLSTPKNGTSAYVRALTISPTSERIIQDTKRVFEAMHKIRKAKGGVFDDINNRSGKRGVGTRDAGEEKRGGAGTGKRLLETDNYDKYNVSTDKFHSDVHFLVQAKVERSANLSGRSDEHETTAAAHASAPTVSLLTP